MALKNLYLAELYLQTNYKQIYTDQNRSYIFLQILKEFFISDDLRMSKDNIGESPKQEPESNKIQQTRVEPTVEDNKRRTFNRLFGIPQQTPRPIFNNPASTIPRPVVNNPASYIPPPNPINQPEKRPNFANLFGYSSPNSSRLLGPSFGANINLEAISFADDDEIALTEKLSLEEPESKIECALKSQYSDLKLNKSIVLPSLCSIKGNCKIRTKVDIICVIDISGSMHGQKIALVRDALKYVVEMLTQKDRLSIVVYDNVGTRLCPLHLANSPNKAKFQDIINKINANGGNIMLNGLEVAIKILRERKNKNEVTSIFLLSDGQQPAGTQEKFKAMLQKKQNQNIGSFSLQSFGFGRDHDEKLMTKMCSIKDGNFYFINKLSSLDQAFCNALGGIFTQAASNISVTINCIESQIEGISISKVHGNKWKKIDEKTYSIQLNQIMSQVSKDFAFELTIPQTKLQGCQNITIARASYSAIDKQGNKIQGESLLKINLLEKDSQKQIQADSDVVENYLRINAVEKIEESIRLAQQGKYEQSKQHIEAVIQTTKICPKVKEEKVKGIIEDLEAVKSKCSKDIFAKQGKKEMVDIWYSNNNKTSFQYSNQYQKQMLFGLKETKSKK